jgi:hypothetical protein
MDRPMRTRTPRSLTVYFIGSRRVRTNDDRRVVRLVDGVYRRLPAHDRHTLRALIQDIVLTGEPSLEGGTLGRIVNYTTDTAARDIEAMYAERCVIHLSQIKLVNSDAAAMHVIAHEFAHIVLRHWQLGAYARALRDPRSLGYSEEAFDAIREAMEDSAHLKVWGWGFQDEMAAFFQEFPEARRPRWYPEGR